MKERWNKLAIKCLDIIIDVVSIHGPLVQFLGIFSIALLICGWLLGFGLVQLAAIFDKLTIYMQALVDSIGWLGDLIFLLLRKIFHLPPPPDHWKPVVVCALFIPLRAVIIEIKIGGDRLVAALFTLISSIVLGIVGAYAIVFASVSADSPVVLLLIVLVFSSIEFVRNIFLAYFRRKDESETFGMALRFYHGMNTVPNFLLGLIAFGTAIWLSSKGISGSWVLGFMMFLVLHAMNMFFASVRVQHRLTGGFSGWYATKNNQAKIKAGWASLDTVKLVYYILFASWIIDGGIMRLFN